MNWLNELIIKNHNIVEVFGGFWLVAIFSAIVVLIAGIIFGNRRNVLLSQKGKTEFARFYSNPDNLVAITTSNQEQRSNSRVRNVQPISPAQSHENKIFIDNTVPQTTEVIDFYFEFNDQYYLP